MSDQRKKRAKIFLLFSAAVIAATVFVSCRGISGRMTDTQSVQTFSGGTGQTEATSRLFPATTEPEKNAQFTSQAPAGQDETTKAPQATTATALTTEEKESSRTEKIPFETEYVYSDDEYEDFRLVSASGKEGLLRITEKSIYEDGVLVGTETVESVISEAENKVIIIGTKPIYTYKSATVEKEIGFESRIIEDSGLYEDERAVVSAGKAGKAVTEYEVKYEKGVEISRRIISARVIAAKDEVVRVGTTPVFTYETVTGKENKVAYTVRYVYDNTLPEGERKTLTKGKDGYTENTYKITYERGFETKSELVSSSVTEPVTEVIAIGTKKKEETFAMPFRTAAQGGADYRITQYYGGSNSHGGIDFGVYYGAPITASMSGTVIYAYNDGYFSKSDLRWTYGTYVVIDHGNGYLTYYAHLKSKTVSVGDRVSQGDIIGYSGNTGRVSPSPTTSDPYAGTHLHFEIRKYISGSYVRVNPRDYLPYWN